MLKLRKIVVLMLAMSSQVTFAHDYKQTCLPGNLTTPCHHSAWHLSAAALYFQPSLGGNGLGYSSYSNYGYDFFGNLLEVSGAPNYLSNVEPNWDWGYKLEGAYDFDRGNHIVINWYHLNDSTSDQLPSGTLFAGSAPSLYAGDINVSTNWDAVNLEFGQYINFIDMNMFRLHAGLTYADIQTTFTNYPRLTPSGPAVFNTKDNLSYSGIGPRVGGDFVYNIAYGFGFYAKAAVGLLTGTAKQSVTGYQNLGGFNLYSTGNYKQSNNGVVVPELEGKLGLTYDYKMPRSSFGIDLAYNWISYINPIVSQVGSGVVSSAISNSTTTNFDLNGVSLGFTWTGNL